MLEQIQGLLNVNNGFFSFTRKLIWVFLLNILFILTSLPIITIGASASAMNSVFTKIINEQDFSAIKDYFRAFKANFVKSTIVWVIGAFVGMVLYVDIFYWFKYGLDDGVFSYFMLGGSCIIAVIYLMLMHTFFPLITRFDLTIKEVFVIGTKLTIKHIGYTFEALVVTLLTVGLSTVYIFQGKFLFMIYLIVCFGLDGFIQSYIYRHILNRYSEDYAEFVEKMKKEIDYYD